MTDIAASSFQAVLFDQDDDSALLLPPDQVRKRYTAEQADKIERLRDAVLMLLSCWPVELIARELHLATRTVRALALASAEKVAGHNMTLAQVLAMKGARWTALAQTKEDQAGPKDLMVMAGIALQNARDLAVMGQLDSEKETKEDLDHQAAADAIRQILDQARPPPDTLSTDQAANPGESEASDPFGVAAGVGEHIAATSTDPPTAASEHRPRGGGSAPPPPGDGPIPPGSEGISAKEPL